MVCNTHRHIQVPFLISKPLPDLGALGKGDIKFLLEFRACIQ
jgi:hypothetical protein